MTKHACRSPVLLTCAFCGAVGQFKLTNQVGYTAPEGVCKLCIRKTRDVCPLKQYERARRCWLKSHPNAKQYQASYERAVENKIVKP